MGLLDDGGLLDLGVDDRLPVRGRGEVLPAQDGDRVLANLRQLRLALPVSRVRRKAVGNFDQLYGNGKAAPAGGCCLTLLPLASSSSTLAATTVFHALMAAITGFSAPSDSAPVALSLSTRTSPYRASDEGQSCGWSNNS